MPTSSLSPMIGNVRPAPAASRVFSRFEHEGLISVDRQEETLRDPEKLAALGHCLSTD